MFTSSKSRRLFSRNRFVFPSVLFVLLILAFSVVLRPVASGETGGQFVFEKRADSLSAKPGDRVNFTLSYLNDLGETAYNVTVYDWLPSELAFAGSHPFFDGASDRETGFFRWSRGRVMPGGNGTIVVGAFVKKVPVGTEIANTAHLAYELENGTRVEVTSSATVTVTQAAGVEVFPDQIHSVAPKTGAQTQYNITLKNSGNALDTFEVALRSVAYSSSGSTHAWTIELFNSTGYFLNRPVATVYDDNSNNRTSWTDHGVVTSSTLEMGESAWFMLRVTEAEGTSGSGDAFLDVQFIATSRFDPSVSSFLDVDTIVKSTSGITFAPDYSKDAIPGDTVTFNHIIVNSGQSDVVDLSYVSSLGWSYAFFNVDGVPLVDSDGSGFVDVGVLPKNQYVYVLVRVTVPYSTPAGTVDSVMITARGVASGSSDVVNDVTTVTSAPIVAVSKRLVSENPAYKGDIVTYEIYIVNLGNTKLIRIPLDDAFETTCLNFSTAQPVEGSYDELAGNIHWENLGVLEPGQNITVTVNFAVTMGGDAVRENSNVIDAEDEFGNLISATAMNTDLNVVGAYTLTVTASPVEAVGGIFNATWTVHGSVNVAALTTPAEIWCDEGTTVALSYPQSPISVGSVRYVFVDYLPSAVLSMDSDKLATLNYRTEYLLGFDQAGSSEPVYITVDGAQLLDALPVSFWIEKGSVVTFSYPSVVLDSVGTTRFVLTGVSGSEMDTSVTVNAPTVVTGLYKTQYYLSVITDPEGLDNPQFGGWYDAGASAQLEVETLTGGDGASTRFRFDHWSGVGIDDTFDASTQILIDAPKTAAAHFVKQYFVTVVSLHDSPTPSQWVDEGANLTVSVASPTETIPGQTRWRNAGYGLDGEAQSGTICSLENIQAPHVIEFYWVQQLWLQVDTSVVEASVSGTGWYDVGLVASVSAVTPYQPSSSHRFVFVQWASTGSAQAPIAEPRFSDTTIVMGSYYAVQANWQEQWYVTVISPHDAPTSSQWVDATENLQVSVTSPADDDGAGTRYRCVGYGIDGGALVEGSSYTFVSVEAAHTIEFQWITQHYLTLSTNFGEVTPQNGWYDAGSIVSVEAFAPATVQGKGYVWHGWTGAGDGSYVGVDNPADVTINGVIFETAAWKIDPVLTVVVSNGTVANGDRIVVYGETSPAESDIAIVIVYSSPRGSVTEHTVYTDDEGKFTDVLVLGESDLYPLFMENGNWSISAFRVGDIAHETGQASTGLSVESRSVFQFPPILLAGAIMIFGLVAFVPPVRKKKNGNVWRRVVLLLSIAGLILGAVSLALNWVVVAGSVVNDGMVWHVDVQLYPFSQGAVSISDGLRYVGPATSALVQMRSGPVLALYLIAVGCALALVGIYKPQSVRQRNLKTVVLVLAGVFFASSVINAYLSVQSYANAMAGAGVGFGAGVYVAIVSCALTLVSAVFSTRENNGHEPRHADESRVQLKMEERPFFADLYPLKSDNCVRFRQIMIRPRIEPSEKDWCSSHIANCKDCASWHVYYDKIVANARWQKDSN